MIKEIILIVTALFIINVIIDNKRETKKKKNYNKKILAIIIITIIISLFVISIIFDSIKEETKKQEIINYVLDNKEKLLEYINNNYDDPEELNKFKVKIYPNKKRKYIEFVYFNDTVLTSFKYYGFYYSFDGKHKVLDLPSAKNKLKKDGNGYYYQSGDDSLYTEKIIDNFYFYKMMY